MTAGAIAVPTIVPLRPPLPGKSKSSVDSNTKIELNTGKISQRSSMIYTYFCILKAKL